MHGLQGKAETPDSQNSVDLVKAAIRKLVGSLQKDLLEELHLEILQPLIDLLVAGHYALLQKIRQKL